MTNFLKQIFTWWNRQTIGTFFYTLFTGKFVGDDEFGNNAAPINDGRCCNFCNETFVIRRRLFDMVMNNEREE